MYRTRREKVMRFDDSGTESVWDYPRPPVVVPSRIRGPFKGAPGTGGW
ncbi:hypothetical protein GCM10010440_39430 [Kitasatospora cinereorecta]